MLICISVVFVLRFILLKRRLNAFIFKFFVLFVYLLFFVSYPDPNNREKNIQQHIGYVEVFMYEYISKRRELTLSMNGG